MLLHQVAPSFQAAPSPTHTPCQLPRRVTCGSDRRDTGPRSLHRQAFAGQARRNWMDRTTGAIELPGPHAANWGRRNAPSGRSEVSWLSTNLLKRLPASRLEASSGQECPRMDGCGQMVNKRLTPIGGGRRANPADQVLGLERGQKRSNIASDPGARDVRKDAREQFDDLGLGHGLAQ